MQRYASIYNYDASTLKACVLKDLDEDHLQLELDIAQEEGKIKRTPKRRATMVKTVDKVWCQDLRDQLLRLGLCSIFNRSINLIAHRRV